MGQNKAKARTHTQTQIAEEVEEEGVDEEEAEVEEKDVGSSPPLNPQIPEHSPNAMNSLEDLKARYYKQQLPRSLQPNEFEKAFASETQQKVQNDELDAD